MRTALALVLVAAASASAVAHPILIDDNLRPPPPPPQLVLVAPPPPPKPKKPPEPLRTWLGLRFGAGSVPVGGLSITTMGLIQADAEIELTGRARAFAEYGFYLASATQHDAMATSLDGTDHRFDGGLIVDVYAPSVKEAKFPISIEAGGGIDLMRGQFGDHRVPIVFAGIRAGFEMSFDEQHKPPHTFGFQLTGRAVADHEGIGCLIGIGMQWGR